MTRRLPRPKHEGDYAQRLDRMKQGRQAFQKRHGRFQLGVSKRTIPDEDRAELRGRLCAAALQLLLRCSKEGLLPQGKLDAACMELGLKAPG